MFLLFELELKKKFVFAFIVLSLSVGFCSVFAGENQEIIWADSVDTAKDAQYLTDIEKNVIREMNMVRTNPQLYAHYLKEELKYYDGKMRVEGDNRILTQEGTAAIMECIRYLEKAKPVGILKTDRNLWKAAKDHAKDQGKTGKASHSGSDKSNPLTRIKRYYKGAYAFVSENIAYGSSTARGIVMQLLIDDGVPGREHRNNIMNPRFDACGVSIQTHSVYQYVCVIDYIDY